VAVEKTKQKDWPYCGSLKNKAERSGHIVATEKTKQKEVDRWEVAKKQSRKKW
jgi:hypothetical protein